MSFSSNEPVVKNTRNINTKSGSYYMSLIILQRPAEASYIANQP